MASAIRCTRSSLLPLRLRLLPRAYPTITTTTIRKYSSSPFDTGPAPPRLPAEEQAEFERLQRTANTQEGFNPSATPTDFVIPEKSKSSSSSTNNTASSANSTTAAAARPVQDGDDSIITPLATPLRKGAPPEFEGEVNPKTGEVGGPKNEPLRWGAGGDYSYNGRVTDF